VKREMRKRKQGGEKQKGKRTELSGEWRLAYRRESRQDDERRGRWRKKRKEPTILELDVKEKRPACQTQMMITTRDEKNVGR
jgi:hypothetical protein